MNPDGTTTKTERTERRRATGDSTQKQDVTVAGKVIGQASTPQEALDLVAKFKSTGSPEKGLNSLPPSELKRIASKPRGVSTREAAEAQAEIDSRQGASQIKPF